MGGPAHSSEMCNVGGSPDACNDITLSMTVLRIERSPSADSSGLTMQTVRVLVSSPHPPILKTRMSSDEENCLES